MTFAHLNLDPKISKALDACGYTKPTPIQSQSIPQILLGKDIVASAQTGTGKTAAFVLPALHRLASQQKRGPAPRVLILTPTRELATQITGAVSKYSKFLQCNIASLVGGMSYRQQLRSLSRAIDIIVATPGRLMDHMSNQRLDLSQIDMLILDEADRMLDMGFIDDVKHIASAMPKNRQTLLFSATVDDRLTQIIRQFLKDPARIDIATEKLAPAKITQELYLTDSPQHKMQLLTHFASDKNIFKAIIFSATKINADRLASQLEAQGFPAAALHGDLKQSMRTRTLEQLRRGKIQFLVATDVAARGIDIHDITHVINFDLPKFSEDYVHRIGRTGRAGRDGIAISFALPSDMLHVQRIERLIRQPLERKVVAGMEPRKQSFSAPGKSAPRKKKFGGGQSYAERRKKDHAREGFAARKNKKGLGGKRDEAVRGERKEFASRHAKRDEAPRRGDRKEFTLRHAKRDETPRRDRKEFASQHGKKKFDHSNPAVPKTSGGFVRGKSKFKQSDSTKGKEKSQRFSRDSGNFKRKKT